MTKRQTAVISLLTVLCLVLAVLISRRLWFRLDLTRNKAYTISAVSRGLYAEITDQVRITYYVSDRLAAAYPVPGEITDLLREYAAHSKGKIRLTLRDPAKAGLTQRVEQLGIIPQQIQSVERDEASFATVYTGIVIEYLDRTEVLPWVFALDTLEYDLTSRIRTLVRGSEREAGILLGSADKQWSTDYRYLNQVFIQSGFRLRQIAPGSEIPDALPVLFVFGGTEDMDDWDLYRIDRYIQGGGKVFFSLESVYVDSGSGLEARIMADQGLLAMVSFYGATVKPELALDRAALTIPYQTMSSSGLPQYRLVRYPHWVGVQGENGNPDNPITAGFGGVDMFWPNPIELNPPETVKGEILFSSTGDAWLQTKDFTIDPMGFLEQEEPDTRGTKILAAALSGKFPSWFQGMPKPVREGEELPDMPAEPRDSRIVVVGDADLGSTFIQATQSQRNLDFLLQAADWLGNDDDIIGIRNRLPQTGRLDRITDPVKRVKTMIFSRLLNMVIIPLAVIALGFLRAWRRRSAAGLASSSTSKERELSDGL
jgi:ABC-type uncharacterized transport system involved in gliding motility auxiliary subunit